MANSPSSTMESSVANTPPSAWDVEEVDYKSLMEDEIVIAVMGVTGAGKSHLIRQVTGRNEIAVGDGLESCTDKIASYRFKHDGLNITLVDTPGFNDTYRTDTDVLLDIATWMEFSYRENFKLSGIIYLHPISAVKMEGSALRNLRMFRKLCGEDALNHVFLATTHWKNVPEELGHRRVKELRENPEFWKGMLSRGAKVAKYLGDRESGLDLIDVLVKMGRVTLGIQHEIVNEGKELYETAAGEAVNAELARLQRNHETALNAVKAEWMQALRDKDEELKEVLSEERQRIEEKLAQVENDRENLRRERRREIREQEDEWHRRVKNMEGAQQKEREEFQQRFRELQASVRDRESRIPWMSLIDLVAKGFVHFMNSRR
ncbi:P-loop containing nucleoside triphosphate hydrolase protein [Tuber indicum]|nr:P-loop containing nucleoside triphosphate hydrolase protein [Tuber indicum]